MNILTFLIGISFGILVGILISKIRVNRRINDLSELMNNLRHNNFKTPMKQDEFSKLEDEIYKVLLELIESKSLLNENILEQERNIEDIAHQIKTPITSILFEIEVLEDKGVKVDILKEQINRLSSLSEILLKLASIESNNNKMKKSKAQIEEIVEYSLDILHGDISINNIEIKKEIKNSIIEVDFYWVCEAMINILKNSISKSSNKRISISTDENPIYNEIVIMDEGGGIKKEDLKHIFNRFYKTPDSNGFGIGLTIAKTIMEKNLGIIDVTNSNKGAIFSLKFYKK